MAFGVVAFSSPEMQRLLGPCHAEVGAEAREAQRLRTASLVWCPNRARTPVLKHWALVTRVPGASRKAFKLPRQF